MAKWDKLDERGRVEDRRGMAPVVGGLSLTGVALVVAVNLLTGGDLGSILSDLSRVPRTQQNVQTTDKFEGNDPYEQFASTVIGSNNELWEQKFEERRQDYTEPTLVLFRQATQSQCGGAYSAVGPHYCPLDNTIYLDETFFDALTERFGAEGGDVAEAYVMAHEVAHHVQHELGIMQQAQELQRSNPGVANDVSVRLELQADCLAGIWAGFIQEQDVLNPGEIREAMDAAASIGDDRIQEKIEGRVNPESFTHGSSDQRVEWFSKGFESESIEACDTFASEDI